MCNDHRETEIPSIIPKPRSIFHSRDSAQTTRWYMEFSVVAMQVSVYIAFENFKTHHLRLTMR